MRLLARILCPLLMLAAPAGAAVTITLPQGGLYQPGRYLAVAVNGAGGAQVVRVEADGAIPTVVADPQDGIVLPLLVVDATLANLRVSTGDGVVRYDGKLSPTEPASAPIAGPAGSIVSEDAYRPTFGWRPGRAWAPRRSALALAAALTTGAIAAALLRQRRRALLGVLLVSAAGAAAAAGLHFAYPPVHTAQGLVLVRDGSRVQADHWWYQTARQPSDGAFAWRETTYPVFFSRAHREALNLSLRAAPDGRPIAFTYQLAAGGSITFFIRSDAATSAGDALAAPSPSPLLDLAPRLYRLPVKRSLPAPDDASTTWFGGVELGP